jgi:hypothetical protein
VKAFDRVDGEKLWTVLYKRGIPHHLIAVIRNICEGTKINLITNSGKSSLQK